MNEHDESIERLVNVATKNGALQERIRVMAILVQYKRAGWLDEATAHLLSQDIAVED